MGLVQPFFRSSIEVLNYFNINLFKNLLCNVIIIDFFCYFLHYSSFHEDVYNVNSYILRRWIA